MEVIIINMFWSTLVAAWVPPTRGRSTCNKGSSNRPVLFSSLQDAPSTATETSYGAISMSKEELTEYLGGTGRANLVWDCYSIGIDPAIFHSDNTNIKIEETLHGDDDFESITRLLPSRRRTQRMAHSTLEKLALLYQEYSGQIENGVASLSYISTSADSTTKLLLKLHDGLEIETVIIPWKGSRSTLCVSSQVGCRQGCTFCATGRMGILRSLTSDEILAQIFWARKICRQKHLPSVQNIVFMGMGEAGDNLEQVSRAVRVLTTREQFKFAATKVTVSTVGPTPQVFGVLAKLPCVVAWSVHAANDELRKQLVPTTKYSMSELRQGLIDALASRPLNFRTVMLEVALMANINDGLEHAHELADFCQVILDQVEQCKLVVNLIPFNDIGHFLYQKPTNEAVFAFRDCLWGRGIYTHVRATRGDDESAACGQLATKKLKKQP